MKKILLALICWIATCPLWAEADIAGYWKSISEKTGKPQCVVVIYEYKGNYFGRMIGSFDDDGKMDDTFENPHKRATALPGQPYYSGLDFIWGLRQRGSDYKGQILNPEDGNVYKAVLWTNNGNLKVEGKLLGMGRTQTWVRATKSDYPPGLKLPNVKKFVPVAPVAELRPQIY